MRREPLLKSVSGGLALVLTFGLLLTHRDIQAQSRGYFVPYSTAGFGIGTSNYYGDLAPYRRPLSSTFKMMRWSVGGNYTRHFTPRLAARASFIYARIAGDDYIMNRDSKHEANIFYARNLHFRNDLKEFSLQGIFKLTPDNRSYDRRPQLGAYLFAGIALTAQNPKALDSLKGDWVKLQPLGTEGQGNEGYAKPYSLVQFAIPVGIGVRYKINSRFDISAELGFRKTFTDYLDDTHGNYADPALFADNPLALAMANRSTNPVAVRKNADRTQALQKFLQTNYNIETNDPLAVLPTTGFGAPGTARGNSPTQKDAYMFGMIHVHYMLPSQIKCPPLK
ncbi:DUF6089 family protein [Dyadobacter sandarakinus]|uniref:DUF6089 domain-containing protein n=1 Tax=Dyadobacter sandarakinus TaxID=2747268 RepID=A0ABX7ID53_9BACT|nr:DUF6089 family protein [Dyadobacter sandarakinus]QRR03048.1 hypothetical protein HWI92_20105 [Dyadobacter sandarakinus]